MPEFEDMSTDEKLEFLKRELGTTRTIMTELQRQHQAKLQAVDGQINGLAARVKAIEDKG